MDWTTEISQRQQVKTFDLRACEPMAPVYVWFTEGFAARDLKDARALDDLASQAVFARHSAEWLGSSRFDDVTMLFAEQAYRSARLVDDDGEQTRDITAKDAHVQRLELCYGGERAPKVYFRPTLAG